MFYTIISNQGMGIMNNPVDVGETINSEPVIEVRSFINLPDAYIFGCNGSMKRRHERGKFQPVSLPRLDEFLTAGKFFHLTDMTYPPDWAAIGTPIQRYFAYLSGGCFGILTSPEMVASGLEKFPQPAIVLEVNSVVQAQQILLSQVYQMLGAISAYLMQSLHLPQDIVLQPDVMYPLPAIQLSQEGQQIWGNNMVQLLPSIDHTPKQVMSITSPKK